MESLTPQQQGELILNLEDGSPENEIIIDRVFEHFTNNSDNEDDDDRFVQFLAAIANTSMQVKECYSNMARQYLDRFTLS